MHALSIPLLLAVLAVGMAQPSTETSGVPYSAPTRSSFDSSTCLFTEKDVSAQDLATIKKSCDPGKQGDSACKACLCSMQRAISKTFSATTKRQGNDTELNNCIDTAEKALGQYASDKSWRSVISDKTIDCVGFLIKTAVDKDSQDLTKMCAGFTDAGGAAQPWAPVKLLLWCIFLLVLSAMLA